MPGMRVPLKEGQTAPAPASTSPAWTSSPSQVAGRTTAASKYFTQDGSAIVNGKTYLNGIGMVDVNGMDQFNGGGGGSRVGSSGPAGPAAPAAPTPAALPPVGPVPVNSGNLPTVGAGTETGSNMAPPSGPGAGWQSIVGGGGLNDKLGNRLQRQSMNMLQAGAY